MPKLSPPSNQLSTGPSGSKPPPPPINVTLDQRNQIAEIALSVKYDALNQLIAQAEKHLKDMKPPHDVWTTYDKYFDEYVGFHTWHLIGLSKYQGAWRLCHAHDGDMNHDGLWSLQPLVECPIEVRLQSVKHISELQEKIVKAKEEYVPRVDEALKELTAICTALSRKGVR
jgi:hypothetical protein